MMLLISFRKTGIFFILFNNDGIRQTTFSHKRSKKYTLASYHRLLRCLPSKHIGFTLSPADLKATMSRQLSSDSLYRNHLIGQDDKILFQYLVAESFWRSLQQWPSSICNKPAFGEKKNLEEPSNFLTKVAHCAI